MNALYKYILAVAALLFVVAGKSQTLSGFSGSSKVGSTNYGYYIPLLPGSAKLTNGTFAGGPLQVVADTSTAIDTTVAAYDIDSIPPQTVLYNYPCRFYIKSNTLAAAGKAVTGCKYTVTSGNPTGVFSINRVQLFSYVTNKDTLDFEVAFQLYTASGDTVKSKQSVHFRIINTLQPPPVVYGVPGSPVLPDVTSSEFSIQTATTATKPVNGFNFIDSQYLQTRNYSAVKLIIEPNGASHIDLLNNVPGVDTLNLYADTLIVRGKYNFPQTVVNIYAKTLVFDDASGVISGISTTPLSGPARGLKGLNGGDIYLNIQNIVANPGTHLILTGGNGEAAPDTLTHIGAPGNGGNLYTNVDVTGYYVSLGGLSGNGVYDTAVVYNGTPGGYFLNNNTAAWMHPNFMHLLVDYCNECFFNGYNGFAVQEFNQYKALVALYDANGMMGGFNVNTLMQIRQILQEMNSVLYKANNNLDFYGNPSGWVPRLSFEVEATAYTNDASNAMSMLYLDELIKNANATLAQKQAAFYSYAQSAQTLVNTANATYHDLVFNQVPAIQNKISNNEATMQYLQTQLTNINQQLDVEAQKIYDDRHRSSILGDILGGASEVLASIPSPYTQGAAVAITGTVQLFGSNSDKNGFQQGSALTSNLISGLKPFTSGALADSGQGLSTNLSNGALAILGQLGAGKPAGTNTQIAGLFNANQGAADSITQSITGIVNLLNNVVSVNSDELGSIKGNLIANDPEIAGISDQIQGLSDAQVQLAQQLQQATSQIIDAQNTIDNGLTSFGQFDQASVDAGTAVNTGLAVLSGDMRRKAFERLRLYYYYMVKAYEYRTLKAWPGTFITESIITEIDSLLSASGNAAAIGANNLNLLTNLYTASLQQAADSALNFYQTNLPAQDQKFDFYLTKAEVQSLNAGNTINLNINERIGVLLPERENVRIDSLSIIRVVTHAKPGNTPQGPQSVVFLYPDQFKLRQNGQVFYFNNYSNATTTRSRWQTDINLANNTLTTSTTAPSAVSLLSFLLGSGSNAQTLQLFSTPPAWSDIPVQLSTPINSTAVVDSVLVHIDYEYSVPADNTETVIIRTPNKWFSPTFYIGTPDLQNRASGQGGYIYRYYHTSNSPLTVTAPVTYGKYSFVRWTDDYGNPIAGADTSGKNTIRFPLTQNWSLNTVYQYAGPILSLPDTVRLGDSLTYGLHIKNIGTGPINWLVNADSSSTWVKSPTKLGVNDTTINITFDSNPDSVNQRIGQIDIVSLETEKLHNYVYFIQNKGKGLSISSVSPDTSFLSGTVTIKGQGFKAKNVSTVTFGGVAAASFTIVSDTIISAVLGSGASGAVKLTAGTSTATFNGFVYVNAPVLYSFTPATAGQGAVVTITGKYLSTAKLITFGGQAVTSFTIVSDSVITAVLNSGVTGSVSVKTAAGTATLQGFSYCKPTSPSISIKSNLTGSLCSTVPAIVTFTATPVNGGSNPVYQWYKNSLAVGTNSPTYADGALNNNDSIWCILNSSSPCFAASAAKSNIIVNKVTAPAPTVATISNNVPNPVCPGSKVIFTAKVTNGGTATVYQWVKNFNSVGTNSATYLDSTLVTGDSVWCNVTSNTGCVTGGTVASNTLYITLNSITPQSVSVSSTPANGVVTFTAVVADPGAAPLYKWYKNNLSVGTNSNVYNDSSSASGDSVWCVVTTTGVCVVPNPVKSNVVYNTPVITSIVPQSGPIGSIFTINGSGLDGITSVSMGGGSALVLTNNSLQATIMVMPGCNSGQVGLVANLGTATGNNNFTITSALAPNVQQGAKLRGAGTTGNYNTYQQGWSMALSADGSTALVGAPAISTVYAYTRSNGVWSQQATLMPGVNEPGYDQAGASVALSADGNTAIIGSPYDGASTGAAYIFNRSGGSWSQTAQLAGTGNYNDQFGTAVGMSGDGQTVVVSEPQEDLVWIYFNTGGFWGYNLLKDPYQSATDLFGQSVGISADASTIIVGEPAINYSTGGAVVYNNYQDGNGWQATLLTPVDATSNSLQGTSVALNANGSVAIVGGPGDNYNTGAAWLYTFSGGNWPQWGGKLTGGGSTYGSSVGQSVGISADGNTVVLGGPNNNNSTGAAWVFSQTNGSWQQQGNKLVGSNINDEEGGQGSGPQQGYSVALSYDGTTAFVGGIADNGVTGAAWPFVAGPAIYSFTPTTGRRGDTVIITGNNFSQATYVAFDSIPAASFTVNSNTQITAVVGLGGTGKVTVTTPGGTATKSGFVFCNPAAPSVVITDSVGKDTNVVNICKRTKVTFIAKAANVDSTPLYQWWKNGLKVGAGGMTYTDSLLNNGDSVYVTVVGGSACSIIDSAKSNAIKFIVNALVVPTVTITDNIGVIAGQTTVCAGTTVSFTATPVNGGNSPYYQWMKNGVAVAGNGNTYSDSQLNSGDSVMVALTSNAACLITNTANSKAIKFAVNATVSPSVTITDSVGNTANVVSICSGTKVKFTAYAVAGTSPVYQWKKNGVSVGTNSKTYTDSLLKNGDSVFVVVTGNAACSAASTATSNAIKFTVNALVSPSVTVSANISGAICAGTKVTFTATVANAGTSAVLSKGKALVNGVTTLTYTWYKDNKVVGTNSSSYVDSTLKTGDSVWCVITSNGACLVSNTATSAKLNYTVNALTSPSITVSANIASPICTGTKVTFTATTTNGGTAPVYKWYQDNAVVGTNSNTYADSLLKTGDSVWCVVTSNAACLASNTATSAKLTYTVNALATPSISITSNIASPICTGTKVTFTATITNGGTAPAYKWYKDNVVVGTNISSYADSTLKTGDSVWCVVTSNASCLVSSTATSSKLTYTVNALATPSVSITSNIASPICTGTKVTFTATVVNGGTAPVYKWYKDNAVVGTNISSYADSTLKTGDSVWCVVTSNAACLVSNTATSAKLTYTVNALATPSVSITSNIASPICTGTKVTFTASVVNGGTAPVYKWYKDNAVVGTNISSYADSTLKTGDSVWCVVTSNAACLTSNTATSAKVTYTVNALATPSISITSNIASPVCTGAKVTFTATVVNGGTAPVYKWYKDNVAVGTNISSYADSTLKTGDSVWCVVTSNAACLVSNTAISAKLKYTVNALATPYISIAANIASPICTGTKVTFTATVVNGGTAPVYKWYKDNAVVGTNSNTYADSLLKTGDSVWCVVTSNAACLVSSTATSAKLNYTVNALATPSVSITSNIASPICTGTKVIFTAAVVNGGAAPVYKWYKDNLAVGTNSSTYADSLLKTGDSVWCVVTSNAACLASNTATSAKLKYTVNALVAPSISIAANIASPMCTGTKVTFNATATNGGTAPVYKWYKDNAVVGTNSNTYADSLLKTGDSVWCVVTSNAACLVSNTAASSKLNYTVNALATPSISITSNIASPICTGTKVTFTASVVNGGTAPVYKWYKDNVVVGTSSNTYADSLLKTGDSVWCVVTSNAACLGSNTATSAKLTYTVNALATPSISITSNIASPICTGTKVTFTATITNGGTAPVYKWYKDNAVVGTNSNTYADSLLKTGDSVWCVVTSNAACMVSSTATSAKLNYTVNALATPSVSITSNIASPICTGTKVTFTATVVNGGTAPVYKWYKDNVVVGTNSNTYADSLLKTGDSVWFVVTSNAACLVSSTATSAKLNYTVNALATPSISIAANTASTICTGTKVTFTATVVNGGTLPIYKWYKDNIAVGTNSSTYADSLLKTGDSVWCVVTSNAACLASNTATSIKLKYTVNALAAPSVSITSSTASPICTGTKVTFTATVVNGGTAPVYKWYKDNVVVGTNSNTYADSLLKTGDSVWCVVTSNASCLVSTTATSTKLNYTVNALATPSVSITSNIASPICTGTKVTFTATTTNGGTAPVYKWYKDNAMVGTNSNTYADSLLKTGDSVWCVVTSNAACLASNTATSAKLTYTVNALATPSISITSSIASPICTGTKVTFNATATNGGTAPVYKWYKDNVVVGTNSSSYADSTLKTGDSLWCVVTSNAACLASNTATSSKLTYTVNALASPSVSITSNIASLICTGSKVTFTATVVNGGTAPVYKWYKDNAVVGTNISSYADSTLKTGDSVWCVVTSNAACLASNTATSAKLKYTVNALASPSVSITSNIASPICTGTKVTFTATVVNGGTAPVYKWYKDNAVVGTNSNTYADSLLKTGDSVWCVVTSNAACLVSNTATSSKLKYTVNALATPSVSITSNIASPICTGTKVTFTAKPVNSGTPVYQWYKNRVVVGINSSTYTDSLLKNNDTLWCIITSNAACITTALVKSNIMVYAVNKSAPALPSAISGPATVKAGQTYSFKVTNVTGVNYIWAAPAGDTIKSGQGTDSITVKWGSTTGTITVQASNGCGISSTVSYAVSVTSGTINPGANPKQIAENASITVLMYPNPTSGSVNLNLSGFSGGVIVSVTDMAGHVVWQQDKLVNGSHLLQLANLAQGMYIVTVKDRFSTRALKLVKAN